MRKIEEIVKIVADFLNREGIDYVFVGAIAVSAWGNPRSTRDVDLIVVLEPNVIEKFVDFLRKNDFIVEREEIESAIKEKSHFSIMDKLSDYWIDVKGIYDERDRLTFERKFKLKFNKTKIFLSSPEDTIASKLLFASEQDIVDAKSIYVRQKNLDLKYLKSLCKKLGVLEKLKNIERDTKKYLGD